MVMVPIVFDGLVNFGWPGEAPTLCLECFRWLGEIILDGLETLRVQWFGRLGKVWWVLNATYTVV
jgi:hypothetical protein